MNRARHAGFTPRILFGLGLAACLACVSGCQGTTPIKTVLDDPSQWEGKTVRVAGTVKSTVGVLGTGVYRVDDHTGVLTVVSETGGAPREGAEVAVEGKIKTAFTLGTESATVLLESRRAQR